ncbi:IS30 family transposase [Pseudonocardia sp. ICBG162]|uniref:IS30 family transposase n=1 Tax=Pseudonocardia sp. ICBG162 TaxID=2846761 RepID=UPI001CF622CA|nr:IS30 family transposase [Pseudonocardia sp. ICBG162]
MPEKDRADLWVRWGRGETISDIARAIKRLPGSVFTVLKGSGGYVPPPRRRRPGTLTAAEREEISRGLAEGVSMRAIAGRLGRPASTVSREIARNKGRRKYRAVDAEDRAWRRAQRPKVCLLACRPLLRGFVADMLGEDWSPEQIAGHLAKHYEPSSGMRVSHETIYKSLFVQARGVLAKDLQKHLRSGRPIRRNVHNTTSGQWRSQITDAVSIRHRPAEVADRAVPGHWEGDLLLGRGTTQIATVVERTTRFTVLVALGERDMHTVAHRLSQQMIQLPRQLRRSLTWDRGMELARHKIVTDRTGLDVYFADPASPWQRGTNENTNRLLRQYFPKGTRLDHITQAQLDLVAERLDTRPRKTLDFDTPADRIAAVAH